MCQLSPVTFHGDTIFCIDYQDQPYTPMRPIVENMGLDWGSQSVKLNANKERWTVAIIATVAQDGSEREMLCLPVRKLPSYLNSINPRKVRPELRAKIELYQAESDDALWNYWMHGRAERPAPQPQPADGPLTPALRAELKAIVDAKLSTAPAEVQGRARAEIWTRFNRHFKIAEYAQLPAGRMAEARDYLIEMQMKTYPANATAMRGAEREIETHCAAVRSLVAQIDDHMAEIFRIARRGCAATKAGTPRRSLAVNAFYTLEDAANAIGHSLSIMERTAQNAALSAGM